MAFRPEVPDDRTAERLQATHWNTLDAHERVLEARRFVPAVSLGTLLRCPVCGKDWRAREMCVACGDEEQAA